MTILSEEFGAAGFTRHQMRLDRQSRVGILRNPKEPPRLAPRKATLTGRWLDLRSRRRLRRDGIDLGLAADVTEPLSGASLVRAHDGRVSAIDIDRLMAEAEAHEGSRAARRPFAHGFRAGVESPSTDGDEAADRLRQSLRTLSIAASDPRPIEADDADELPASAPTTPAARRSGFDLRRFLVGALAGIVSALVVMVAAFWAISALV